MNKARPVLSVCFALAVLGGGWGCSSGGSQPGAGNPLTQGQTATFGELTVRSAILNPPIVSTGTGTTVTGFTGSILGAEVRPFMKSVSSTYLTFQRDTQTASSFPNAICTASADGSDPTIIHQSASPNAELTPSWSPDGAKIVFASIRATNGTRDIFTMNADGTGEIRLTNNTFEDSEPAWSADGTLIAFTSERDGNKEIYTMNANGTNQTRLTNNTFEDSQPSWQPNGVRIAFRSNRDGNPEIYTINASGSQPLRVTVSTSPNEEPAWSPEGDQIAFTSLQDGNREIYVVDSNGGFGNNATRLTNNTVGDSEPTWSPDGKQIAFRQAVLATASFRIFVMNKDGSNRTQVSGGEGIPAQDRRPRWSPFIKRIPLVGTESRLGTVVSGLLYATGNRRPASAVVWNTVDFSALKLTALNGTNSTGDTLIFSLEGGAATASLTRLAFWNFTSTKATVITTPTSALNGALIYIDAWTGAVNSILPFAAPNRSAGKPTVKRENGQTVAKGSFLGVWNGSGKNIAPQGASSVRIDARTGAVLNIQQ